MSEVSTPISRLLHLRSPQRFGNFAVEDHCSGYEDRSKKNRGSSITSYCADVLAMKPTPGISASRKETKAIDVIIRQIHNNMHLLHSSNTNNNRKLICIGTIFVVIGFLFQIGLEHAMRPYAKKGIYFHRWSSEATIQTVSIQDLREAPFESLINIHIEPPGFDIIRAILVRLSSAPDIQDALHTVDLYIYRLWALAYGLLACLVFLWTAKLTETRIAILTTGIFMLHPAFIFYTTFLDTTLLSSLLVIWAYYLLWKLKNDNNTSLVMFALVSLGLFFTRSIFQWPSILLFGTCLFLLKAPRRKLLAYLLIVGGISSLYMAKQYYQFRLLSTSSFMGMSLARSVGIINTHVPLIFEAHDVSGLPQVLTRKSKIDGTINYNNISFLETSHQLTDEFWKYISTAPVADLAQSYFENTEIYFRPSSRNGTTHVIVDRLPWRSIYDAAFSAPILPLLILIAVVLSAVKVVRRGNYASATAILMPGLYIFLVSVLFEKGENMRLKFILEPVFYIFIVSEFYSAGKKNPHSNFRGAVLSEIRQIVRHHQEDSYFADIPNEVIGDF